MLRRAIVSPPAGRVMPKNAGDTAPGGGAARFLRQAFNDRNVTIAYNVVIVGLAAYLIYAGLAYNLDYVRDIFTATGALPEKDKWVVIGFQALSIGLAVVLLALRSRLASFKREVLLSLVSLVFALAVIEVGTRLYLKATASRSQAFLLPESEITLPRRYIRHPYLGYVLNPNYRSVDGRDRHNAQGFRGEDIRLPKPKGTLRVVFVGGSTTYGERVSSYREAWPYQTGIALRRVCGLDNIEVINGGVGSYDSFQTLMSVEFRVLDLDPDLIVVHHALNDAHARLVRPSMFRGDNTGKRRPWRSRDLPFFLNLASVRLLMSVVLGQPFEPSVESHYDTAFTATGVVSPGFDARLGTTPGKAIEANNTRYFERNMRDIVAVARANGVEVAFVTWPHSTAYDDYMNTDHYRRAVRENNEATLRVGAEMGVFVYDLRKDMPGDKRLWAENRHVNAEGAKVKARLTAKGIAPLVCPMARARAAAVKTP